MDTVLSGEVAPRQFPSEKDRDTDREVKSDREDESKVWRWPGALGHQGRRRGVGSRSLCFPESALSGPPRGWAPFSPCDVYRLTDLPSKYISQHIPCSSFCSLAYPPRVRTCSPSSCSPPFQLADGDRDFNSHFPLLSPPQPLP